MRKKSIALLVLVALTATMTFADSQNGAWGHLVWKDQEELWPVSAVHMVHLKTGDILMFQKTYNHNAQQPISAWLLQLDPDEAFPDPATTPAEDFDQYFVEVPGPADIDLFCSGHAQLADGRVLFGGGQGPDGLNDGLTEARIFDPVTLAWETVGDMAIERWYPTLTTLPDGRVFANSGTRNLPGQNPPWETVQENEIYDPVTKQWTLLPPSADYAAFPYAYNFLTPNGDILSAGPDNGTRELDLDTEQWFHLGNGPFGGLTGSAAMYGVGLIVKAGSQNNGQGQDKAAVFDMSTDTWTSIQGGMNEPRRRQNMVMLPDGTSLVVGGSSQLGSNEGDPAHAVYEPELFVPGTDPATDPGSFTLLNAPMGAARMYHSSAVLLRDGRVLSGGGNPLSANSITRSGQIYSPPYLFTGTPRPVISGAPDGAAWNKLINVTTPDAATVVSASLIRLNAVTHGFDEDQRFVPLEIENVLANGLQLRMPANRKVAPPGYYMLFLVSDQGVPSIGEYIKLRNDPTPPPPPPPPKDKPHMS